MPIWYPNHEADEVFQQRFLNSTEGEAQLKSESSTANINTEEEREETTNYKPWVAWKEDELHMEWCNWPHSDVEPTMEGKQATRSGRGGQEKQWMRLAKNNNKSQPELKLKGGTKTSSEVEEKVKEVNGELVNKKLKTASFKSTESLRKKKIGKKIIQKDGERKGLKNLKNTCYLNAAIQGLQSCTLLRDAIIKAPEKVWKESRLTRRMKVTFLEMSNPDRQKPWAPTELFNEICTWEKCVKCKEKRQEDAGELITCLIEKLSEENKTAGKLFSADQLNTTRCKTCEEVTAVEQKFQTIALNIDGSESNKKVGEKKEKAIEDLLGRYSERETLTKNNKYECGTCGKHQEADRQTNVVYGPNILVMQLKRF